MQTISILGAGNMGSAIAISLLEKNIVSSKNLILTNKDLSKLSLFKQKWNVDVTDDNNYAVQKSNIIILAVKPQIMTTLLNDIKKCLNTTQLVISIAAGITTKDMSDIIGSDKAIIRVMPNLGAQVGESVSCWIKNNVVNKNQEKITKKILDSIGMQIELPNENLFDAVTAVSGSGPAYLFFLTEIMQEAAKMLGIPDAVANILARQTVIGSSKLLEKSDISPLELRKQVTSKGGTTEAAFNVLEKEKITERFIMAISSAAKRSKELRLSK